MNSSEKTVLTILKNQGGKWVFFEVLDSNGVSKAQTKIYDPPFQLAYPDFEKYNDDKLVLLVEVKGYNNFFADKDETLAMKYKQYRQYFVIQNKEKG